MNLSTNSTTTNGIPIGMNTAVVNSFQSEGVRVIFRLAYPLRKRLGQSAIANPPNSAAMLQTQAKQFSVGMEIDYEKAAVQI